MSPSVRDEPLFRELSPGWQNLLLRLEAEERTAELIQKEIDKLDGKIGEFEKELAELPGRNLKWEEASSVEEVQDLENRRGILKRLLDAAKVKRLELSRERLEAEIVPLAATRTERGQRMQELDGQISELKEKRKKVHIDWAHINSRITGKEHHISQINREIKELRGEGKPTFDIWGNKKK